MNELRLSPNSGSTSSSRYKQSKSLPKKVQETTKIYVSCSSCSTEETSQHKSRKPTNNLDIGILFRKKIESNYVRSGTLSKCQPGEGEKETQNLVPFCRLNACGGERAILAS